MTRVKLNSRAVTDAGSGTASHYYVFFSYKIRCRENVLVVYSAMKRQSNIQLLLPQYEPKIKNLFKKTRILFKKQESFSKIQSKTKQSHLPRRIWCKLNPPLKPEIFTVYTFMNKNFTPGLLCIQQQSFAHWTKNLKFVLKLWPTFTSKIQSSCQVMKMSSEGQATNFEAYIFVHFQKKIFQFMNKIFTPGLLSMCNASSPLPQKLSISPTGSMTPLANF